MKILLLMSCLLFSCNGGRDFEFVAPPPTPTPVPPNHFIPPTPKPSPPPPPSPSPVMPVTPCTRALTPSCPSPPPSPVPCLPSEEDISFPECDGSWQSHTQKINSCCINAISFWAQYSFSPEYCQFSNLFKAWLCFDPLLIVDWRAIDRYAMKLESLLTDYEHCMGRNFPSPPSPVFGHSVDMIMIEEGCVAITAPNECYGGNAFWDTASIEPERFMVAFQSVGAIIHEYAHLTDDQQHNDPPQFIACSNTMTEKYGHDLFQDGMIP